MSRPFSLRRSSSVFIRAMLCALLLPVCVAVSAQTNRPAATQEGRQPALDPKVEKLARLVTYFGSVKPARRKLTFNPTCAASGSGL